MIMDKHLKNIFRSVDKQTKLLQKQMGKVNGNKFVKGQEKFVFENMMPPMIHATVTSYSRPILMLQCSNENDFTQNDIDIILDYLDNKVYNVIRNPNATQNELREAFLRMTCFAYMIVSTRSRPKAAEYGATDFFSHIICFNTQPPEGG